MNSITKIIIGLLGIIAVGLLTYYIVSKENNKTIIEKPITNPNLDTVAKVRVFKDTMFGRIKKALSIEGEEFTLSNVDGVYLNTTKDKMLVIKENVWKKIIRKAQIKFPNIAKDCNHKDVIPSLSEYKFVGLLTYLADNKNIKYTTAFSAVEIRNGNTRSFAAGNICCDCEGEPLVAQQVDAVIVK